MASVDTATDTVIRTPLEVYLGWAVSTIYWTLLSSVQLLYRVLYSLLSIGLSILNTLYRPVAFLIQPLVYLVRFALLVVAVPFRLLVQLEPLYIYLGIAALVGVCSGLLLAILYSLGHSLLQIGSASRTLPRSAKDYREEKRRLTASVDLSSAPSSPVGLISDYFSLSDEMRRGKRRKGLTAQTIAEEDSDF